MKIALIGYGKMGKAIEEIAVQKQHEIVLKVGSQNSTEFTKESLQQADVAVEFTSPHSAFHNVKRCIEWGVPVVCGSTGWLSQLDEITTLCKKQNGSFLYASNFSVGVNLFFELNKQLARLMNGYKEYDVWIMEIHHTQKKDAPSGTAISLAEQVLANHHAKKKWVTGDAANENELSIISERIDPSPGTHIVNYSSEIDDIEIIHTAHNRKGFASGAVLAAEFIAGKKGVFTMQDVLGI